MHHNILFDRVKELIESYDYSGPFSLYLKELFKANPKMGARDRRETRDFCYHFYRIGNNLNDVSFKTKLAVASFLCSNTPSNSLEVLLRENSDLPYVEVEADLDRKISTVKNSYPQFELAHIFPEPEMLSDEIDRSTFLKSFLIQPRVWIRVRTKFIADVTAELKSLEIPFDQSANTSTFSFSPMQKLEHLESYKKGYFEIQDLNSQRILDSVRPQKNDKWWDTCAASGGKSLGLIDKEDDIFLFATDIRESSLRNYTMRMKKVGYEGYNTQIIDLTKKSIDPSQRFDGILADVPCSGSGTWSRSPENLIRSCSKKVKEVFQPIQRKIVGNAVDHLRIGGTLVYSTCSVFMNENENNVDFFLKTLPLQLKEKHLLKGYTNKADSLFVATFEKVS